MKILILVILIFKTTESSDITSMHLDDESTFHYSIPDDFNISNFISPHEFFEPNFAPEGRIVHGQEAMEYQFPHQTMLILFGPNVTGLCGGSIIHQKWILTAAHCLIGIYYARVGYGSTTYKGMTWQNTSYLIPHPKYSFTSTRLINDIGLIKLCKAIEFDESVKPIRLVNNCELCNDLVDTEALVSGFGLIDDVNITYAPHLKYGVVKIISNIECMKTYSYLLTPWYVCTQGELEACGPCNGDSGGALINFDEHSRTVVQIGIVSFGSVKGCDKAPAGYTRVLPHLKWINNIMGQTIEEIFY